MRLAIALLLCGLALGCGKGGAGSPDPRLQQALDHLKSAAAPEQRLAPLAEAARWSLAAGKTADAAKFAREILDLQPSLRALPAAADAAHVARQVLGRIALREGRTDEAKRLLMESILTPGPRLTDYGPGMGLAKELLEKGERQAVLDYLAACARFWNRSRLEEWSGAINDGKTPDFPANLLE
jgi:tetratricopeptide (TPR) repeat protein